MAMSQIFRRFPPRPLPSPSCDAPRTSPTGCWPHSQWSGCSTRSPCCERGSPRNEMTMTYNYSNPTHHHHDVVVVGARCAGAATAMLLASAGHDVLLVDRSTFPSDTLSTHAIARGGMVQLERWGLLQAVLDTGAPPIRAVEFHSGGLTVTRTIKDRSGIDMLVAPRRHALDTLLVNAAMSA